MKTRLSIVALAFLIPLAANSEAAEVKVEWRESVEAAEAEVLRTGKAMLIQTKADWCVFCHKMIRETFSNPRVAHYVNTEFVPVQIDPKQHGDLIRALRIESFPSTAIVSADFKTIYKITGFKKVGPFTRNLTSIATHLPEVGTQNVASDVPAVPEATPANQVTMKPAAFGGTCLVSLLDHQELVSGDAEWKTEYRGKTLHFASQELRKTFLESPEKYWPALDGACPITLVADEQPQEGSPQYGIVWHDQIWFPIDAQSQKQFMNAPEDFARNAGWTAKQSTSE